MLIIIHSSALMDNFIDFSGDELAKDFDLLVVVVGQVPNRFELFKHVPLSVSNQLLLLKLYIALAMHERAMSIAHPTNMLVETSLHMTTHTPLQALVLLYELSLESLLKSLHLYAIVVDFMCVQEVEGSLGDGVIGSTASVSLPVGLLANLFVV